MKLNDTSLLKIFQLKLFFKKIPGISYHDQTLHETPKFFNDFLFQKHLNYPSIFNSYFLSKKYLYFFLNFAEKQFFFEHVNVAKYASSKRTFFDYRDKPPSATEIVLQPITLLNTAFKGYKTKVPINFHFSKPLFYMYFFPKIERASRSSRFPYLRDKKTFITLYKPYAKFSSMIRFFVNKFTFMSLHLLFIFRSLLLIKVKYPFFNLNLTFAERVFFNSAIGLTSIYHGFIQNKTTFLTGLQKVPATGFEDLSVQHFGDFLPFEEFEKIPPYLPPRRTRPIFFKFKHPRFATFIEFKNVRFFLKNTPGLKLFKGPNLDRDTKTFLPKNLKKIRPLVFERFFQN